jgi:type IV secretory pathway TraG/TraD family ATPase VirD4
VTVQGLSHLAEELGVDAPGGQRIALGRTADGVIRAEERQPVLVLGAPRTGKTTGFIIPSLLEWEGPAVVTSIRRDVVDATLAVRQRRGRAQVFEPTGQLGDLPRVGWDPVGCSTSWDRAMAMAYWMTQTSGESGMTDERFWYSEAQRLLAPLFVAAHESGGSMRNVLEWLQREEVSGVLEILEPADQQAFDAYFSYVAYEERLRGSVRATASSVLNAYQSRAVLDSTEGALFDPELFLDGGANTLYLCAPASAQSELAPLITGLVRDLVAVAYQREAAGDVLDPAMLVCLDEAGNVCRIPDLDHLATTAAGSGMQLVTVFHNLNQAITAYGMEGASTIVVNHGVMVVFPGLREGDTYRMINSIILSEELPPDVLGAPSTLLRRLQRDEVLCIYRHLPPETLVARRSYDDPELMGLLLRASL